MKATPSLTNKERYHPPPITAKDEDGENGVMNAQQATSPTADLQQNNKLRLASRRHTKMTSSLPDKGLKPLPPITANDEDGDNKAKNGRQVISPATDPQRKEKRCWAPSSQEEATKSTTTSKDTLVMTNAGTETPSPILDKDEDDNSDATKAQQVTSPITEPQQNDELRRAPRCLPETTKSTTTAKNSLPMIDKGIKPPSLITANDDKGDCNTINAQQVTSLTTDPQQKDNKCLTTRRHTKMTKSTTTGKDIPPVTDKRSKTPLQTMTKDEEDGSEVMNDQQVTSTTTDPHQNDKIRLAYCRQTRMTKRMTTTDTPTLTDKGLNPLPIVTNNDNGNREAMGSQQEIYPTTEPQ